MGRPIATDSDPQKTRHSGRGQRCHKWQLQILGKGSGARLINDQRLTPCNRHRCVRY
jgi:hypothetical protein